MGHLKFDDLIRDLQSRGSPVGKANRHEAFFATVRHLKFLPDSDAVFLVGGTNGKGSVAKILERLWTFQGEKVGLLTSPHLISPCERIVKSGRAISEEDFLKVYQLIETEIDIKDFSFSECLTLMALTFFFHPDFGAPVQRAVFEVGVGGLNDAVNAIPHAWAVLTQVGSDHRRLLGEDLLSRFRHKVGIAPEGGTMIVGNLAESLQGELARHGSAIDCRMITAPRLEFENQYEEGRWFPAARGKWRGLPFVTHSAAPAWLENLSVALAAFEVAGGVVGGVLPRIPEIRWPGRWQYVATPWHPHVLFSGDHNMEGWLQLVEWLRAEVNGPIHVLFSIGEDKSTSEFFSAFQNLSRCEFYGMRRQWRGQNLQALEQFAPEWALFTTLDADPLEAFRIVCDRAGPQALVVVTGSLYGLGELAGEMAQQGFHLLRA